MRESRGNQFHEFSLCLYRYNYNPIKKAHHSKIFIRRNHLNFALVILLFLLQQKPKVVGKNNGSFLNSFHPEVKWLIKTRIDQHVYVCIYIYIYRERERERERFIFDLIEQIFLPILLLINSSLYKPNHLKYSNIENKAISHPTCN